LKHLWKIFVFFTWVGHPLQWDHLKNVFSIFPG
jgi:hypothetical protein